MTNEHVFSAEEVVKLRSSTLLHGMPSSFIDEFVAVCLPVTCEPYSSVYNGRSRDSLPFSVLIEGCLAVWDDSHGQDTIDALITRGQVIGEFDFLGYPTHSYEVLSLSSSILARPTPDDWKRLVRKVPDGTAAVLYRNLSKTLVEKLMIQNSLLKFRTGNYVTRIAKLCDNFTKTEWSYLTDLKPNEHKNSFMIRLLFKPKLLLGLIEGQKRQVGKAFRTLIENRLIDFVKFNTAQELIGEAMPDEFLTERDSGRFPDCGFFSLKVLDRDKLSEYTLGESIREGQL